MDDLYDLPPSEFVAARNRLAAELRKAGEKERAAEVKALRRPSVAAWAVNRVAREDHDLIQALVDAASEVRAAQNAALSGGDAARLRDASRRRRELVERAASAAGRALARDGGSATPHHAAIRATLEAASSDTDAAVELLAGRLERELDEPAGFGDVAGLELVPPVARRERRGTADAVGEPAPEAEAEERANARARRAAAEAKAEEAEARARSLRMRADAAKERAARLESELSEVRAEALALDRQARDAAREAQRGRRAAARG